MVNHNRPNNSADTDFGFFKFVEDDIIPFTGQSLCSKANQQLMFERVVKRFCETIYSAAQSGYFSTTVQVPDKVMAECILGMLPSFGLVGKIVEEDYVMNEFYVFVAWGKVIQFDEPVEE